MTPIPLTLNSWQHHCQIWPVINETRLQTVNGRNKIVKWKSVVFYFGNNCFQCHESHQLSTSIRISAHLFFHEKPMTPGHCTGNFLRLKRQSKKEQLKTKLKNSIKFFEKVLSKPLKPESVSLKISKISIVFYVERQYYDIWTVNNVIMWEN